MVTKLRSGQENRDAVTAKDESNPNMSPSQATQKEGSANIK